MKSWFPLSEINNGGFMKKYLLLILVPFLFCGFKTYVIDDDGKVLIMTTQEGVDVNGELKKIGKDGRSFKEIDPVKLPPKEDRDFFKLEDGEVVVDEQKKAEREQELAFIELSKPEAQIEALKEENLILNEKLEALQAQVSKNEKAIKSIKTVDGK